MKDSILKDIKPEENIKLTSLSPKVLKELLRETNEYILVYRPILYTNSDTTFGIEIEYEKGGITKPQDEIEKLNLGDEWMIKRDGSVSEGGELATPILTNKAKTWETLGHVCNALKRTAETGPQAGGHIHIGTNVLKVNYINWIKFLYLWVAYEHVIIRFTNGEYLKTRNGLSRYAIPTSSIILKKLKENEKIVQGILNGDDKYNSADLNEIVHKISEYDRYKALNLINARVSKSTEKNTFEFRCPNATLEQTIWQNNINLLTNLLENIDKIDLDLLKDKIKKIERCIEKESLDYNGIDLRNAIELADLIFNHTIDKIYFLRQYIKDYQTSKSEKTKCSFC